MTDGVGFKTFSGPLGGVCDAFPAPQYQVLGRTAYDQDWIDKSVEAGVAGCGYARPEARPAALDLVHSVTTGVPVPSLATPKKGKLSLWGKAKAFKSKLHLRKSVQ